MARKPRKNKVRPELVKVRVSPVIARALRRLADEREVSLSRLCYDVLRAHVQPPAAAA